MSSSGVPSPGTPAKSASSDRGRHQQIGARRPPRRTGQRREGRVPDDRMIAVTIARIERDHDIGAFRLDECRDRGLDVAEVGRDQRPRRGFAGCARVEPAEQLDPGHAEQRRRCARSSASRISPRFVGVGSPAASPAISPSSPRVAHATTHSTPRDAACASTEPQPNASSSGWATVRSSFTDRAGAGSRERASPPKPSARRDQVPGAQAARAPVRARPLP